MKIDTLASFYQQRDNFCPKLMYSYEVYYAYITLSEIATLSPVIIPVQSRIQNPVQTESRFYHFSLPSIIIIVLCVWMKSLGA